MAKRKKRRTAAQRAATAKMIAANKHRRRANPARKRKAPKKIGVKTSKTGRKSVKVRAGTKMSRLTKPALRLRESVKPVRRKRKGVTRRYTQYKSGKKGLLIRENPTNQTKAIVSAAGGFALGIVAADVLDRYVATRKTDQVGVTYGTESKGRVNGKSDSTRIFAQAAGTGVSAVGAYLLRKKSVVGTYLLGGMATAFAAKGLGLILRDHIMPALFKDATGESIGRRLGYVDGPRRAMMGAPRPFRGEPTHVGPQAAGSVGGYGCTRAPINPSAYAQPGQSRASCKPFVPDGVTPPPPRVMPTPPRVMPSPGNMMPVESSWEPGLPGNIDQTMPEATPVPVKPGFTPGRGFAPQVRMPFEPKMPGVQIPGGRPSGVPAGVVPSRFSTAPVSVTDKIQRSRTPVASRLKKVMAPQPK